MWPSVRSLPAEGAKPAEMPGFIKPQLARHGPSTHATASGLDWTKRFSAIAGAFDIPGGSTQVAFGFLAGLVSQDFGLSTIELLAYLA